MRNYALVDKVTGRVINALSTPTDGVTLTPENEHQEVMEISLEDFNAIFKGDFEYWNYETRQFEPKNVYKWELTTPGPHQTGIITLVFEQRNWRGEVITKPVEVTVTVNDKVQQVQVDDGTLELELDCPEPVTLRVKLEAERHEPFETEVTVNG